MEEVAYEIRDFKHKKYLFKGNQAYNQVYHQNRQGEINGLWSMERNELGDFYHISDLNRVRLAGLYEGMMNTHLLVWGKSSFEVYHPWDK
ncbi:MAG: hypothetical protein MRZ79_13395 [Bacteroidia bacterium]|nr:hypothetical protein [Bacteroidia bacterium]